MMNGVTDVIPAAGPQALFAGRRPAPWGALAWLAAAHTALLALFYSEPFTQYVSLPLFLLSRGLLTHTLVACLVEGAVLFGGLALGWKRLGLRGLGLRGADLRTAVVIVVLLWSLVQGATVLAGQVRGAALVANPVLGSAALTYPLGRVLATVFGSALVEEVLYRGFLLPQLYLLSAAWWGTARKRRLLFALAASQLFFGLNHLPAGLHLGFAPPELLLYLAQMTLGGVLLAALYLRTGNLLLAVGVHALINNPAALVTAPGLDPSLLVLILAVGLLWTWPWLARGSRLTLRRVRGARRVAR